jgi:PAS domain S-box-containing protein
LLNEKMLECGFQTVCALTTQVAFDWLKNQTPTLMLLDYNLPEMNGSEFISELKHKGLSAPPFILATGQGDERIAVQMMKLGARDYIVKDTNYLELILVVVSKVCKEIENENKLKFAEQEIIRIGKHYQTIIDKSPDGFVLLNQESKFKYLSPSALRMFGYDELEIMSILPTDLTHPEDVQKVLENLEKLFQLSDFVPVIEYRFKHKNGDWIWIESTFSNLLNDPNVGGILINFRDISERKRTEKTLKLRETYLTAIIENLPGIIWLKDAESHIQLTNTKFAHTFGKEKPEDLLGKTDLDFSPKEHAERYLADDKKVVSSKKPLHVEELIFDQHAEKWFETFKMPILDENMQVIGTAGYSQDITDRKLSELELAKNQKELTDLFNGAPVGYHELDIDGKFVRVNQTELNLLGYTREEFLGMYAWDIGEHQEFIHQIVIDKLAEKVTPSAPFERNVRRKDNSLITVMIQDVFLYDEQGNISGIRSTFQDVSEKKRAEDALKTSLSLLHASIESTADGILVVDLDGKATLFNHKFANMWGIPDELLESGLDEQLLRYVVTKLVDPDKFLKKVTALYKNPELTSVDEVQLSDGRTFTRYSIPQKIGKKTVGRVWSFRDITDRLKIEESLKTSEDKYRTMIEQSNDLIWTLDVEGNFLFLNDVALKITDSKLEDWVGKSFVPLILPEDLPMISDVFQRTISGESCKYELRLKKQDESLLTISVNSSPIYVSGKIEGAVSFGRDITERKKAEQALQASEELYRNLVERIPDGVYKSTPEGRFVEINPAMVQLLGYESKEELLAIDIKSALYFNLEERESAILEELHEETGIFQLKKKDGSAIWMEDHGWYTSNDNNEIVYHEGVLRDITDRKTAEQALERRLEEMTRFHNLTVDRELKMIELKKEINELLKTAGEEERYVIVK